MNRNGHIAVGVILILGSFAGIAAAGGTGTSAVAPPNATEEEYVEPAPQEGDYYFRTAASDGSWIS